MMQVHHPEGMPGQVRTCQGHDLDLLTMQGWRLVFSYQETTHIPCNEMEPSSNPNHYNGTISVTRYKPNVTTFFVLHKTENQVIDELNQKVSTSEAACAEQRRLREEVKKAHDDLTKAHDTLKNKADFDARCHKNVVEERDRFRTSAGKLEADLAKIRKAIGERAFHEILPPPEPKA